MQSVLRMRSLRAADVGDLRHDLPKTHVSRGKLPRGKVGAVSAEGPLALRNALIRPDLKAGPAKNGGSNVKAVRRTLLRGRGLPILSVPGWPKRKSWPRCRALGWCRVGHLPRQSSSFSPFDELPGTRNEFLIFLYIVKSEPLIGVLSKHANQIGILFRAGSPVDQHCIKVSLITLILQYRFATPKPLKTRPGAGSLQDRSRLCEK